MATEWVERVIFSWFYFLSHPYFPTRFIPLENIDTVPISADNPRPEGSREARRRSKMLDVENEQEGVVLVFFFFFFFFWDHIPINLLLLCGWIFHGHCCDPRLWWAWAQSSVVHLNVIPKLTFQLSSPNPTPRPFFFVRLFSFFTPQCEPQGWDLARQQYCMGTRHANTSSEMSWGWLVGIVLITSLFMKYSEMWVDYKISFAFTSCVCMYACRYIYICVCVCMRARVLRLTNST